ncbi:organic solvent tolerance protein OstA [Halalkalibacter krulwichiae]|uniref:Uncharacterized protein n=1 Tax=Halalkalibacter krulwichiae TaxID=199441 RepID=A0A1X9MHU2_9BACI|nr:organic solvent tolerance protein OstA [Halalkalibacter krulwichiae]ARK32150.1 hypothetical protein BkAM31D_21155 [Halalkalibacter krulwichiae]
MTVKELNMKKQSYAGTQVQAEKFVEEAKKDMHLVSWKISEKYNKYGQYFLIDLAYSYNTPKEIMEAQPEKTEDPHEGIEYAVDLGGNVEVKKAVEEVAATVEDAPEEEWDEEESEKVDSDDLEDDELPF